MSIPNKELMDRFEEMMLKLANKRQWENKISEGRTT